MVKIIQGKEQFVYYPEFDTITMPKLESQIDLFSLLHEFGHVANKDGISTYLYIEKKDVIKECQAWAYAFSCIKPKYYNSMRELAIKCINRYNSQCEISSGEWLSLDEINNLIL